MVPEEASGLTNKTSDPTTNFEKNRFCFVSSWSWGDWSFEKTQTPPQNKESAPTTTKTSPGVALSHELREAHPHGDTTADGQGGRGNNIVRDNMRVRVYFRAFAQENLVFNSGYIAGEILKLGRILLTLVSCSFLSCRASIAQTWRESPLCEIGSFWVARLVGVWMGLEGRVASKACGGKGTLRDCMVLNVCCVVLHCVAL